MAAGRLTGTGASRGTSLWVLPTLAVLGCGGSDHFAPKPAFYTILRDSPCSGPTSPVDTFMQPGGHPPNAGSGFIDSTGPGDRRPRAVFWVYGYSSVNPPGPAGFLTFILLHTPSPLPVGSYTIRALSDSTVWLEGYTAPWFNSTVGFDMTEPDFIVEPFTGGITIEESDGQSMAGTLDVSGKYKIDGVVRCMSASSRFSSHL